MKVLDTKISEVKLIEVEPITDHRGSFSRLFCKTELDDAGVVSHIAQINGSTNVAAGVIRGLHYQAEPFSENKIVRCVHGAIFDVAVDMRANSKSFLDWVGYELSADNNRMLVIPPGFAHGYQTLTDEAEIIYFVSQVYSPEHELGVRFDDPRLNIDWPMEVSQVSDKDSKWRLL